MNVVELIFGLPEKKAFEQRREQILAFRADVIRELDRIAQNRKIPELRRQRAEAMRELVGRAEIKAYPVDALAKGDFGRVLGANQKIILFNPQTKRYKIVSKNVINLPQYHLFHENKLTARGKMTILHEFAHTISPREFRADIIAVTMGARLGIPKAAIARSIVGRRVALGAAKFRRITEVVKGMRPAKRRPMQRPRLRRAYAR